jgi:hypothetical protein
MVLAGALSSSLAMAQPNTADRLTQEQILNRCEELKIRAEAGDGSANIKLAEYPNHYTMLSYRTKSGGGEVHEQFTDVL